MSNKSGGPILVTGATGTQGGCTARALIAAGYHVRALVRNPSSRPARAIAAAGADLVNGDMDDADSLDVPMKGAYGVFSVQNPDAGGDSERRRGYALVKAARQAAIHHFIHTSVSQAGTHTSFPQWDSGYWSQKYWTDKWDVEEAVRNAGFPKWTVLRPAFLMECWMPPKVDWMFPALRQGTIVTALLPDSRMHLLASDDVGTFACAALSRPDLFSGKNITLSGEALTMHEVAATLSRVLDRGVTAVSVSPQMALASGLHAGWVRTMEFRNKVFYEVNKTEFEQYGIPLTSFPAWVEKHRNEIVIDVEALKMPMAAGQAIDKSICAADR